MTAFGNRRTATIGLVSAALVVLGISIGLAARPARRGGGEPPSQPAVERSNGLHAGSPVVESGESDAVRGMPLAASTPEAVRAVVGATRKARPEDAKRLRGAALSADDPLVAGNAVRALGHLECFAGDPELLRLLDDPRSRVRQESVMALDDSAGSNVERLAKRLEDEDPTVRALALRALAGIDDARAETAIASALADPRATKTDRAMAASRRKGASATGASAVRFVRTSR